MKKDKRIILNPHADRKPCVPEMCEQCEKQFEVAEINFCEAWLKPAELHRRGGCFLKTDKKFEETAKMKLKRKFGKKRRNR
jgi:hypothetical protein